MDFQTLLNKVFNTTWERDHHVLFNRCIEACLWEEPTLYWTCVVKCHEYFNQILVMDVEVV